MDRYGPRQVPYDIAGQYGRHQPTTLPRQPKYSAAAPIHPPLRRDSRHASEHISMQPPQEHRRMRQVTQSVDCGRSQPRSVMADAGHWDTLRQQGYVLRGSMSDPSLRYQAPSLVAAPSTMSYATSAYQSSIRYQPSLGQRQPPGPVYQVHPHVRTSSHPQSTPKFSQPANAFMRPAHPTHREGVQHKMAHSMDRPILRSRPTSTTIQKASRGVQLKPEQIFMYARPSKASYYEPEHSYAAQSTRPPNLRRDSVYSPARMSAQDWDTRSSYAESVRSTSSRPQTPCQMMNVQPQYPPSPISASPELVASRYSPPVNCAWAGASSAHLKRSKTLRRQETTNSLYSQQTYHESYTKAMAKEQQETRSNESLPNQPPLERSETEMTLGTAQRLWHELEQQLLGEDTSTPRPTEQQPPLQALPCRAESIQDQETELDFTESSTSTQPLRPPLNRRKSSHYRYKGHERHGEVVLHRARDAADPLAHSVEPSASAGSTAKTEKRPAIASLASKKQVTTLRSALRRKTPANERLEVEAMRELVRQSAPSEADHEELRLDSGDEESLNGSHADGSSEEESSDGMTFTAGSGDESDGETAEVTPETVIQHKVVVKDVRLQVEAAPKSLAQAVKTVTKIPAPVSRTYAGKLYKHRETIRKV